VNACSITNCFSQLFAVLQALHFTEAEYLADCRACHALSELTPQHPLNTMPAGSGRNGNGKMDLSWPYFCVSISFTKEAIVAVRTGELNGYCNSLGVLETLHAFHKVSNIYGSMCVLNALCITHLYPNSLCCFVSCVLCPMSCVLCHVSGIHRLPIPLRSGLFLRVPVQTAR